MKKRKLYVTSIWCSFFVFLYGQESKNSIITDSLFQKDYEELENGFNQFRYDTVKAKVYAKAYLDKGKQDENVIKQAEAYSFLSHIAQPQVSVKYADSIIAITRDTEDYNYPAKGFLAKAYALRRMGNYKEAINQYLKAYQSAIKNNNPEQQLNIKYHLAILKNDLGEHQEALIIFKEYAQTIEEKFKTDKKYIHDYTRALFSLGDSYNRNEKYDSAAITNKKGLEISLKNENAINPAYFILSAGITEYHKKNYTAGIDSIQKAIKKIIDINDTGNLSVCYLSLGKIYKDQGKKQQAIRYFKKIDSMVKQTSDVFPEIREAYEYLIDYYKEDKDSQNQLEYVKSLLHVDSLLLNNYKYLSKNIAQKYDTPELVLQKDQLINTLEKDKNTFRIGLGLLLGITVIISALTCNYYRKQRIYRKKFETLLEDKIPGGKIILKEDKTQIENLNISETALHHISEKLEQFVKEKRFLHNDISLYNMAKTIDTNPKYLSMVIKFYHQKNFIAFINDLRIDHVIEELKNNASFRKYSVKAIAEEIGFNNAQSFSQAFHKKTGIYPSYFIQELEKKNLQDKK